jgi:L-iditol 2-dehydrogenase
LMFTRLLALEKIRVFASDLFPTRLQLAKKFGAKVLLQGNDPSFPEKIRRAAGKQGLDAAIICAPVDAAVQQAQDLINGAGKVLLFAHTKRGAKMPIDLAAVCVDEKDLIGSYSADVTLQREVARLVFSGQLPVRDLITHRFPLAQTAAAVDLAAQPTPESLKVLVDQTGSSLAPSHFDT